MKHANCPNCTLRIPVMRERACAYCGAKLVNVGEGFELAACPPIETFAEIEARKAAVGEAMKHARCA
jgi:hypothetical protein